MIDRWVPEANLGLTSHLADNLDGRGLVVVPDQETLQEVRVNLRTLFGERTAPLPGWHKEPVAEERPEPSRQHRRLKTLENLSNLTVLATTPAGLGTILPGSDALGSLNLEVGGEYDLLELVRRLSEMGYRQQDLVGDPGEFSRRGDLLDLFPPNNRLPVRLAFFDDELESIEYFHPSSQMVADATAESSLRILPRSEFPAQPDDLDQFQQALNQFGQASTTLTLGGDGPLHWFQARIQSNASFLQEQFTPDFVLTYDHRQIEQTMKSWTDQLDELPENHPAAQTVQDPQTLLATADDHIALTPNRDRPHPDLQPDSPGESLAISGSFGLETEPIERFLEHIEDVQKTSQTVRIHAEQESLLERLELLLDDQDIPGDDISLISQSWRGSYRTPELARLSLDDFFNRTLNRDQMGPRSGRTEYLESFEDLDAGDLVVHEDFGIGRFHGMRRVHSAGQTRDCLEIEYADEDRLFLPPDQISRVQKYLADSGYTPGLTSLSGDRWERVKTRVEGELEELAEDLLELYMVREEAETEPLPESDVQQAQFEASFPYRETPDQQQAIRETKQDLAQDVPMDRLICGDSGYGKTEVALRAAFQAASSGKQVAMLVPTTVLARQHAQTFRQRFGTFSYDVGILSRFTPADEEREYIEDLKSGELDVVIGTHRLLGDDVEFDDIGLLIIDEEQRFGVKQKEELKLYREEINVLTLSATPIPRTLYMSLSGVQDISVINTPPGDRNPVGVTVGSFDRNTASRALQEELKRDGQVFWIKNRVQRLPEETEFVRSIAPEQATVDQAHGQMNRNRIQQTMNRFYEGETDVLVCTTIVESGLDCPNANTMVIRDAHRYGLAQLYQLRGRIGRSHREADAYLFYPENLDLTDDAEARLETIKRSAELGSGFEIAMRDLEIRGAGNLLGKKQHGNIRAIGFPLYCKLLQRTVRRLREGFEVPDPLPKLPLPGEYHIPEDYVPDDRARIRQYQALAAARTHEEVDELQARWRTTFGPLPDATEELLSRHRFKIAAVNHGWDDLRYRDNELNVAVDSGETILNQAAKEANCSTYSRGKRFFVRQLSPERIPRFLEATWSSTNVTTEPLPRE